MPFITATANDDNFIKSLNFACTQALALTNYISSNNIPRTHELIHGGFTDNLGKRYANIREFHFKGNFEDTRRELAETIAYLNTDYAARVRILLGSTPRTLESIEALRVSWDECYQELIKSRYLVTESNSLKASVPSEKPAPIRVRIEENRLVLVESQTRIGKIDIASADRLRASVVNQLKEICDALDDNTNVDRRFVRTLRNLTRTLLRPLAECSIEAIGINTEILKKQFEFTREELHDLDAIAIDQLIKSCSVLVSQFEEWKNYLSEADKFDLKAIDGRSVIAHVESLADELEAHKEVVDQEIVARFRDMTKPVVSGRIDPDIVLPALMPSLSNLFGNISNYAFELSLHAPITLSGDQKLAGAIVIAGVCKKIIETYFPIFAAYQPLKFLLPVIDFSAKYFSPIARFFA